jgi:hypothetical protein
MSRSRSRSRSHALPADGPALRPIADNRWGRVGPEPDHPHAPNRTLVWSSTPTLRHIRRALILVDLQQVRQVMEEQFSDAMTATRILTLPDLQDSEELGMFTHARLLNPGHLQATNAGALLYSLVLVNTSFTHGASTLTRMILIYDGAMIQETSLLYETIPNCQSSPTRKSPKLDPCTRCWNFWASINFQQPEPTVHHAYVMS